MKIWQPIKWIIGVPAFLCFMAGFLLTITGLGLVTLGKYLVTLVED